MLDRDTEVEQRLFQCYSFLCEHVRKVATHLCILHQSIERDNDSNISSVCQFLCFDGGYKDVWQLFGHVHTRKNNTGIDAARLQYLYPTQYDVGVDNNNFTPVSFQQVKRIIENQVGQFNKNK